MTALHMACWRNHVEVARVLLAYGANVHDKNIVSNKNNDMLCLYNIIIIIVMILISTERHHCLLLFSLIILK